MKLLVSVIDAAEARLAVAGGVDIVDVKNPAEGSLGAPAPGVIAEVGDVLPAEVPLSAAIGDLPCLPGTAALAALGAVRSGAAYVKLGLWGASGTEDAVAVLRAVQEAVGRRGGGDRRRLRRRRARAEPAAAAVAARRGGTAGGRERLPDRHRDQGRPRAAVVARPPTRSPSWSPRPTTPGSASRWPASCARRTCPRSAPPAPTSPACARPPAATGGAPRRSTPAASRSCGRCAPPRRRARRSDERQVPQGHERPGRAALVEQLGEPRRLAAADHPRLDAGGPQRRGQVLVDPRGRQRGELVDGEPRDRLAGRRPAAVEARDRLDQHEALGAGRTGHPRGDRVRGDGPRRGQRVALRQQRGRQQHRDDPVARGRERPHTALRPG